MLSLSTTTTLKLLLTRRSRLNNRNSWLLGHFSISWAPLFSPSQTLGDVHRRQSNSKEERATVCDILTTEVRTLSQKELRKVIRKEN